MPSLIIVGGTGFIGTELALRLENDPRYDRIAIFSRDWHKHELLKSKLANKSKFRWFIGDVRDKDRLMRAFNGIDDVIHAAALKDLPTGFYSPREVLVNNCDATQNVIDAAIDSGVSKMLFISSDKAVEASSVYGASKCMGEHLVTSANSYSPTGTRFSSVRYGNVWRSHGSVVPVFEKQKASNILTVTDELSTRFWIKADAAVNLILKALGEMIGGEIFIPKLSASRVIDLARAIAPEAEIKLIGIRPTEKRHEVMITPTESRHTRELEWAFRVEPALKFWSNAPYVGGSSVPLDWTYSSASATRLTVDQLREMIE